MVFSSKLVRCEEIGEAQIKDASLQAGRQNAERGIMGRVVRNRLIRRVDREFSGLVQQQR